jgi:exopolyphosphatase/guanosine-5'-triphosphate,3'-diphosphate pyrophosphatase
MVFPFARAFVTRTLRCVKPVRRAVIDVGTNSVKLLVVEVRGRDAQPLWEESKQTRLGRGFYPERILQPEPVALTVRAITEFVTKAAEFQADPPRLVATSAVREARNQGELRQAVAQACGLFLRVISGEQEATYAFEGAVTDPRFEQRPLLLLDVGGGSMELILGKDSKKCFAQSYPLGTVRLLDRVRPDDPPAPGQLAACRSWLREFLEREICPQLEPAFSRIPGLRSGSHGLQLVGTGGTASLLGCMEANLSTFDRQRLEATPVSFERLGWHVEHLWGMAASEREKIIGLPSNRVDVILTGTVIFEAVMERFGFQELQISTRGLRFAVALE